MSNNIPENLMNIANIAQTRYTTKAFDPNKKISDDKLAQLLEVLRNAPSSINSQPWHYIVASTAEGKAEVAKGAQGTYVYNAPKILNASHVVVLCGRNDFDDAHIANILDNEDKAGRFATPEAKATQNNSRTYYANLHRVEKQDAREWMDKQIYIALGMLLLSAGVLEVDACPIEGFDPAALDEALGLKAKGLHSVVLVALGYRSGEDFNAKLPKSRLPAASVFTQI